MKIHNKYWLQAYDSILCGCFFIKFIDFMFKDKSFTDFTNLLSPILKIMIK